MKGDLDKAVKEKPLSYAIIFLLVAALCITFPTKWLSELIGESVEKPLIAPALVRVFFGIAGIVLMIRAGEGAGLRLTGKIFKNSDIVFCGLLIAVNNFPLIPLALGEADITADAGITAAFLFYCVSVGLFEELFFRGLIMPALLMYFRDKKNGAVWAVLCSSAVFGLVHLLNFFGGGSPGAVFMQVGYTFLTGSLFAVVYLTTRSVWPAVVSHALFDVGGFFMEYLGHGEIWSAPAVILTAAVAVPVTAWLVFRFLKLSKNAGAGDFINSGGLETEEAGTGGKEEQEGTSANGAEENDAH